MTDVSRFILAITVSALPAIAFGSGAKQLARALDAGRREGGYVLLAIVDRECSQDVREALAEPGPLGEITRYRNVVADSARNPMLCVRFGARELPLFVLLDGRGNELSRVSGARSPSVIVRSLHSLAESATGVAGYRERLRADLDDHAARLRIADHHWQRQEFVRAVEHYRKLVEARAVGAKIDRNVSERARERLGAYLVRTRRLEDALAILEAVDLDDTSTRHGDWVALQLGLVRYRLSDAPGARRILRSRVDSHPDGPLADRILFTLAHIESETGRKLEALDHLSALEERFPDSRYGRRATRRLSTNSRRRSGD